ncbi:MAG: amidohydrolase [Zhaonellaceae bacterium]|jgi:amidohydrolase|nr:amidohydrolase [Clostridia bacterium]
MKKLKEKAIGYLEQHSQKFIDLGNKLFRTPELGFREHKTSQLVEDFFKELGLKTEKYALTGVKSRFQGKNSYASVGVLGELDAIYCPEHPLADKETGAAHACGHHMQLVAVLAAAEALVKSGVGSQLDGDMIFFAVPAEEHLEFNFRNHLLETRQVEFSSGKQEMLRLGCFDDVDMALTTHALSRDNEHQAEAILCVSCNGYEINRFRFIGQGGHAGLNPSRCVNALNAAILSINGIQFLRDTFPEGDNIRVSFILTEAGKVLNIVPEEAVLEVQIRGRTIKAIKNVREKIIRAAQGGANTIGCKLEIERIPGYKPYESDPLLNKVYTLNAERVLVNQKVKHQEHGYQCTDLGDLSQKLPISQLCLGGFAGDLHSKDFRVIDEYAAYIIPAQIICATVCDLLVNGAELAKAVGKRLI